MTSRGIAPKLRASKSSAAESDAKSVFVDASERNPSFRVEPRCALA
jgi:hypothetical protein